MPSATLNANRQTDPQPGYGFSVQLGSDVIGWFTECSGLSIEREVKTHMEGGVNEYVHQLPGRIKRASITLKHGLAGNELWAWFQKGAIDSQVEQRNVSIVVYHPDLTEAQRWDLVDVYPSKWVGPTFNSANNEVAVETLELAHVSSSASTASSVQRSPQGQSSPQPSAAADEVDIAALAKKIYDLLKQDLRVERERSGRRS